MTPDDIDVLAEAVATKVAQGLLRMPDTLRIALKDAPATGWFSVPGSLTPGPDAPWAQIVTRPDGIEIMIKAADGMDLWRGVIL
jgi:hypothetical protein